jgi:hypothetical protein
MSLQEELNDIRNQYRSELKSILDFVNTTEKSLTRKQNKKPKQTFEKINRGQGPGPGVRRNASCHAVPAQ